MCTTYPPPHTLHRFRGSGAQRYTKIAQGKVSDSCFLFLFSILFTISRPGVWSGSWGRKRKNSECVSSKDRLAYLHTLHASHQAAAHLSGLSDVRCQQLVIGKLDGDVSESHGSWALDNDNNNTIPRVWHGSLLIQPTSPPNHSRSATRKEN